MRRSARTRPHIQRDTPEENRLKIHRRQAGDVFGDRRWEYEGDVLRHNFTAEQCELYSWREVNHVFVLSGLLFGNC